MSRGGRQSGGSVLLLLLVSVLLGLAARQVHAQDTSLSPGFGGSISDPLLNNTDSDGFDTSFDAQTSDLTNPYLRTDISDPTNANIMGSTISPIVGGVYVYGSSVPTPETQVLTDAQQAAHLDDPYFGGRQSRAFSAGQALNFHADRTSNQSGAGAFSIGSQQTSFANNTGGRAAFSEQSASQSSGTSFSGEGAATDDGLGLSLPNPQASLAAVGQFNGASGASGSLAGGDPVLSVSGNVTNVSSSSDDIEAQPSSQVSSFFAETQTTPAATQYDDGQTPLLHAGVPAGQVQPSLSAYTSAVGGFSDSTRGTAASPSQEAIGASPFEKPVQSDVFSPFPAVSDGSYYVRSQYLAPSLTAQPVMKPRASLSDVKRRLKVTERKRVTMGMPYSDAEQLYQKDLTEYMRYGAQGRSRLPDLSGHGDQSSPAQTSMPQGSPQ